MVRIKDRDDLSDVKGRVHADFRSATLTALHRAFVEAAPAAERSAAEKTLAAFYEAANSLLANEQAFTSRERKPATSLMTNLRGAEHFSALRAFNSAKSGLTATPAGQRIVMLVEKNIHGPKAR